LAHYHGQPVAQLKLAIVVVSRDDDALITLPPDVGELLNWWLLLRGKPQQPQAERNRLSGDAGSLELVERT
jgi:hypothetical protein